MESLQVWKPVGDWAGSDGIRVLQLPVRYMSRPSYIPLEPYLLKLCSLTNSVFAKMEGARVDDLPPLAYRERLEPEATDHIGLTSPEADSVYG